MSTSKPLLIYKASAGSGKTSVLTEQFIALLLSGSVHQYRRTMAVTFTNKATREMKGRILTVLKSLAKKDRENKDAERFLAHKQQYHIDWKEETIRKKAGEVYQRILHDYSRLTITTIDKFVQQIIRSFTFELGIAADYQVSLNLKQVAGDLSEMLHDALDRNPELLKWITNRAKKRINEGKNWNYESELLKLSLQIFSEDFQEFDIKIDKETEKQGHQIFEETLHKITKIKKDFKTAITAHQQQIVNTLSSTQLEVKLLKRKSKNPLLKFQNSFEKLIAYLLEYGSGSIENLIDSPENWFTKKTKEEGLPYYEQLHPLVKAFIDTYHEKIEAYKLALALETNLYYLRLMKEMSRLLGDYRKQHQLLLISDATHLLAGITQGLGDNPSFIWEKAGNKYQHFLFDEFQDTSRKQWDNFRPLLSNTLAVSEGKRAENIIVGDVKQSIYRWRGGDWKLLLEDAKKQIGIPFVAEKSLTTNFRSDARIIDFNNTIFPTIVHWLQENINREIAKTDDKSIQEFWFEKQYDKTITEAYKDVVQNSPEGKKENAGIVDWVTFPVENNKSRKKDTLDDILEVTAHKLYHWIVEEQRYKPRQIGILVRGNAEAETMIAYLREDQRKRGKSGAYDLISGDVLKLKDHPAIQLIISTFQMLLDTEDRHFYPSVCAFLYHHFQSNTQALHTQDWMALGNKPLEELTHYLPKKIIQNKDELLSLPLVSLIEQIISIYKLDQSQAALPFLFAFRDYVAQFTRSENNDLLSFLAWWDYQDDLSLPMSEDTNAVQVMTIHKAKGLAFDVVMLPFLFWKFDGKHTNNVWTDMTLTPFEELQTTPLKYNKLMRGSLVKRQYYEEKVYCLMDALNTLYVAMTRARNHLFLCLPEYKDGNNNIMGLPRTFLAADLLHYAISQNELSPIKVSDQETKSISSENTTTQDWAFSAYPIAHHLDKQNIPLDKNKLNRLDNDHNIRIGIVVHELLSQCHSIENVDLVLNRLYQEGWFSEKEKKPIKITAEKVLNNVHLQRLLQHPGTFLNERDIMDREGNIHRPDKVLVSEGSTFIIDYKFTSKEKESHFEQVEHYKKLYTEMGYPNVKGWLFYGFGGELMEV